MISVYSVCSAIIFYNLSLAAVFLLRRKTRFLARYTVSVLLFISVLGLVRLFTPIDLEAAYVIRSWQLLPALQRVMASELPPFGIKVCTLLLIIWGCGTAAFAAKDIAAALRAKRARRGYIYVEDERIKKLAAGFGSKCVVKISPNVRSPYVAGIFSPAIYLPDIELTEEDALLILRHEMQHIRSRDGLKKLLFLMIKWLFWWNPLAHVSMSRIDAVLELQCDARVTHGAGDECACEYAGAMLDVLRQLPLEREPSDLCVVCLAGDGSDIKQRFDLLLSREPRLANGARILCGAALLVFLLSYFVIWQPAGLPPENEIAGCFEFTPDNSYIIHEQGKYSIYYLGSFWAVLPKSELEVPPYNGLEIIER